MGCIISARKDIDSKWTSKTLCGKTSMIRDVVQFFKGKGLVITCTQCLIRQDAMLERGYQQIEFWCWYNVEGRFLTIPEAEYRQHGTSLRNHPRNAWYAGTVMMWDADSIKGAIKLGKLGIHGMGLAK